MREISPSPPDRLVDDDRLERVRTKIHDADVDGLAALSPANSFYLTGCYVGMYSRPVVGMVSIDESGFGGPAIETRKVRRLAWVDRAVLYEDADDSYETVATLFEDLDTVGVDERRARPDFLEGVAAATDTAFVDATATFRELRVVKTEWERAMMHRASDLAAAGMAAFREAVDVGVPEIEVANEIQDAYYRTYLESYPEYDIGTANELGQYGFANALTGGHALEPHSLSSANRIENGDTTVGIALPALHGYVCEEERTILVGDVDSELRSAMETLVDIRRAAYDRLEPGLGTDEIDRFTTERLRDAGYADNVVHRTGHGEGITIHEGPALNARESGVLRPGMVISVEPGLYFPDQDAALRHSDTFAITEDGAERLTGTDDGVIAVDGP